MDLSNFVVSKGHLSLTDEHYITDKSLKWEYVAEDTLTIYGHIGYDIQSVSEILEVNGVSHEVHDNPFGFEMHIYNEEACDTVLLFEVGRGDRVDLSLEYMLNFKGWKKVQIPYERGFLKGTPQKDMDTFRITVVKGGGATVFLDDVNLWIPIVPNNIAVTMYKQIDKWHQPSTRRYNGEWFDKKPYLRKPILPLPDKVTSEQIKAFEMIEEKYFELLDELDLPPFSSSEYSEQELFEFYESYNIKNKNGKITGKYIDFKESFKYCAVMKTIALYNQKHNDEKSEEMYINMLFHISDQNTIINWYNGRGVASSLLIMREILKKRDMLDWAIDYIREQYHFYNIYATSSTYGISGKLFEDTDDIGLCLPSLLVCILLLDNTSEKVRDMTHFIYFIEKFVLGYAPGIAGGYKPDGTSHHHGGYILQYETVANYSLSRIMYILSGGVFMPSKEAIDKFLNILNTEFIIYNGVYEPFTVKQYAFDPTKQTSVVEFAHMANALNDKSLAAKYLTMAQTGDKERKNPNYNKFILEGIKPAQYPSVHKTLTYGATAFHRRNDWQLAVRGHSKYVYPMEIWSEEGGRYTAFSMFRSYGFLEILHKPTLETGTNNGIHIDKGFDYTRWPGSTAVTLPLSKIKSKVLNIQDERAEWLLSDQGFVGGLDSNITSNGVFAVRLHGHHKYGLESFYADKSYHFYDNIVVCVGSGISNDLNDYSTETTIFQDYGFGAKQDGKILMDNRNNGYLILDSQFVQFIETENKSRDMMDKEDTTGERTFAFIDHGKAPQDADYSYLINIDTDFSQMKRLERDVSAGDIRIIRQDDTAHIVKIYDAINYVMFRNSYELNCGIINTVTESCIISVTSIANGKKSLSVCDPDLRFYHGASEDYDTEYKLQEKSIYSRMWHVQDSIESKIHIVLNCDINDIDIVKGNVKIFQRANGKTVLEFICKDGLTNEVTFYYNII